jgi:hypothetical protein
MLPCSFDRTGAAGDEQDRSFSGSRIQGRRRMKKVLAALDVGGPRQPWTTEAPCESGMGARESSGMVVVHRRGQLPPWGVVHSSSPSASSRRRHRGQLRPMRLRGAPLAPLHAHPAGRNRGKIRHIYLTAMDELG